MQSKCKTVVVEYFESIEEERSLLQKKRELEEAKREFMYSNVFFAQAEENLDVAQTLASTVLCYLDKRDSPANDVEYSLLTGLILLMCRNEWRDAQCFRVIQEYLDEPLKLLCDMLAKDRNRRAGYVDLVYGASHRFLNSSREAQYEAVLHLKDRFSLFNQYTD